MEVTFEEDVLNGLRQSQKKLSSKYFYDEKGDYLFQKIMQLEEYYLPECERQIIEFRGNEIADAFCSLSGCAVEIVELGAGDGSKTINLLKHFVLRGDDVSYCPMDISPNILKVNQHLVEENLPEVKVESIAGDYFETIRTLPHTRAGRLFLFLGSNIGNYARDEALDFLNLLRMQLQESDAILIAFDLKKNPLKIRKAYNDSQGVTKAFNLNILERINRELGADFDLAGFDHYPSYEPMSGTCYSFLVSLKAQSVTFGNGEVVHFGRNELIHTEISRKYSLADIESLFSEAGMKVECHFTDGDENYVLTLGRKDDE